MEDLTQLTIETSFYQANNLHKVYVEPEPQSQRGDKLQWENEGKFWNYGVPKANSQVVIVVGPTLSGKTAVVTKLVARFGF